MKFCSLFLSNMSVLKPYYHLFEQVGKLDKKFYFTQLTRSKDERTLDKFFDVKVTQNDKYKNIIHQ